MGVTVLKIILLLVILFPYSLNVQSAENSSDDRSIQVGISLKYLDHSSFTFLYPSIPVRVGLPIFSTSSMIINMFSKIKYERREHLFNISVSLPARVTSNNGTGRNYILDTDNSSQWRAYFEYNYVTPLYHRRRAHFNYGFAPVIFYETNKMTYLSGHQNKWRDLHIGIGPVLQFRYKLNALFNLASSYKGVVFIPFISRRWYESINESAIVFSSVYKPMVYKSVLNISFDWDRGDGIVSFGYRRIHTIGVVFRNRMEFSYDQIVDGVFEREHEWYIAYSVKIR